MQGRVVVLAVACALLGEVGALKVGFVGDTTASSSAGNVYKIMRDQGVDVVVQNGDYDYYDRPDKWADFLDEQWYDTGREHVLMSSGNHDTKVWDGSSGYQAKLYNKLSSKLRSACHGRPGRSLESEYGLWMGCVVDDVHFVMLGWHDMEGGMTEVVDFVHREFDSSKARWRVCVWHRPEGSLNPGHRHTSNYGQWAAYEACREQGALIVSGHSHCYGRTKMLSHFESKTVSSRSQRDRVELRCGDAVSIVSGMGGKGPDDLGKYGSMPYMQKSYTTNDGREKGALVCDFPASSGDGKCELYVGDAPGTRHDSFSLTTSCRGRESTVPVPPPGQEGTVEYSVHVTDGADDVEEDAASGDLSFTSSDLELVYDRATQVVGIRWAGVRIPRGATISDARIEFRCDEESGPEGPRLALSFDKDSDSDAWDASRRPSQRTLTRAVSWELDGEEWAGGGYYTSPNVAAALQEVVSLFDWSPGNAVSAVFRQEEGSATVRRTAESFEGDGLGAKLRVRYTVGDVSVPPPPPPAPTGADGTTEVRVRITSGDDDVEQTSENSVSTGSSDLELAYDGADQLVGLRFRDVQVPRGADITAAYVEFTADEDDSGESPDLIIHGEAADSSAAFSTTNGPYTRKETGAGAKWYSLGDWKTGSSYRTPDLSAVIREITDRDGWAPSSSLSLLIKTRADTRAKRVADSYNGNAQKAPLLVVFYKP